MISTLLKFLFINKCSKFLFNIIIDYFPALVICSFIWEPRQTFVILVMMIVIQNGTTTLKEIHTQFNLPWPIHQKRWNEGVGKFFETFAIYLFIGVGIYWWMLFPTFPILTDYSQLWFHLPSAELPIVYKIILYLLGAITIGIMMFSAMGFPFFVYFLKKFWYQRIDRIFEPIEKFATIYVLLILMTIKGIQGFFHSIIWILVEIMPEYMEQFEEGLWWG